MKIQFIGIMIAFSFFLSACKSNQALVISANQIDKVSIYIKDDKEQEKEWEAQDPRFLKSLLGNIHLLFNKVDKDALTFNTDLTSKQKEFEYTMKFYDGKKIIQEITISKGNEVFLNDVKFVIKENKEKELNSLKQQLLLVTQ